MKYVRVVNGLIHSKIIDAKTWQEAKNAFNDADIGVDDSFDIIEYDYLLERVRNMELAEKIELTGHI